MDYLTIANFKKCKDAFQAWMKSNYSIDIDNIKEIDYEKEMYSVMKQVKKTHSNVKDIIELNNIALNRLQKVYVDTLQLVKQNELQSNQSNKSNQPSLSLEDLISNRQIETVAPHPSKLPFNVLKEEPINVSDFSTKLKLYENERNDIEEEEIKQTKHEEETNLLVTNDIIPIPKESIFYTNNYITFSGFDRKWNIYKMKYNFAIDFNDLSRSYKNIASIEFSCLILPMEMQDTRNVNNPLPKMNFYHEQKFGYPYVLLQVQELTNVYDGFNDQVKRACTQFIYDSSYKCPNGRGYVILRPAQKEVRSFQNQPLSQIQKLTLSITKPNGTLFNNSVDDYNIIKYEYETYNSLYLKIITDKYFDKNEFCIGDTLIIKDASIIAPLNWVPTACVTSIQEFSRVTAFINREQGHDVIQLGDPNDNGFYRSFYINAPQILDQNIGKLVVDKALVDTIREYNIAFPVSNISPLKNGRMINVSTQPTISMIVKSESLVPSTYSSY